MSNLTDTSVVFGTESATIEVYDRKQLAAAIRACPHDGPVRIIFYRSNKKPIVYKFDYSKNVGQMVARPRGSIYRPSRRSRFDLLPWDEQVDLRLAYIARQILKAEKGLFE